MTGSTAHPRSRGENGFIYRSEQTAHGSSPLTRGKRRPVPRPRPGRGLIPAHAGKTARARERSEASSGSSPLTRGKRNGGGERVS